MDDDLDECAEICQELRRTFSVEVVGCEGGEEALEKLRRGLSYDFAVVDVWLRGERGAEVARKLLHLRPDLSIVFTSSDPLVDEHRTRIFGRRFPFVIKEAAVIAEFVERICDEGYWEYWDEHKERSTSTDAGGGSFVQQLGMAAFARRSLADTLQPMLARIRAETHVSQAMIFEVNSTNKTVSIIAVDPPLPKDSQQIILDGLYYSPIQDVVEDEEQVYEMGIVQGRYPRFRSLDPIVPFRTFLGIPLKIPDLVTRHALFLFDEHKEKLDLEDLEDARSGARFILMALERALLLDYMRRYEVRYLLGQLLGSLVHELSNKIDALGAYAETLTHVLQKARVAKEAG